MRDSLAEILPWETRDSEMEILVDECREVILSLSGQEETFTGPFVLRGGLSDNYDEQDDEDSRVARDALEAGKSEDKLVKLQPLPSLLANFDLDTHVWLIQRLFEVDPKLVEVHSKLSSGGEREVAFWKNYFFHCAYARYEAGLSIDEIWSNDVMKQCYDAGSCKKKNMKNEREEDEFDIVKNETNEEEIIFDAAGSLENSLSSKLGATQSSTASIQRRKEGNVKAAKDSIDVEPDYLGNSSNIESAGGTDTADYDLLEASCDDGEIDELEAEIAAALKD